MIPAERLATASLKEITAEMVRVRRDIDERELDFSRLAARVAEFDYWDDGSHTAIEWITFECKVTRNAAADSIAVGEQLSQMPESIQAFRAGEIGFAHMPVMARTAKAVGDLFDERVLLKKARDCSAGKFYYKAQQYRHSVQPKAYAQEQAEQAQRNRLSMSTAKDGCFFIKGILDPVSGAAVRGALEPLARPSGERDDREYEQRITRWSRSSPMAASTTCSCRSPARSKPCSAWSVRRARSWSSRSRCRPRRWSAGPATAA